jgi:Endomembrane protein 70
LGAILAVLYALTAGIAGYFAASYYKQMEGTNWVRNVLTTCFVFCGPFFLMFCFNNTVAIVYRVSVSQRLRGTQGKSISTDTSQEKKSISTIASQEKKHLHRRIARRKSISTDA